jgi:A/G-specific adenine glycosylase
VRRRPAAQSIGETLVEWYSRGCRDLPWRATRDPYAILVSEIMLQQTRAQTVVPYYHRFLERFPTAEALAASDESAVLALWSGLGYYSRARNLRRAAQRIVVAGGFPRDLDGLRELPGIGEYTAAAVASIAFGLPYAAVDGNVLRVAARVTNDAADIAAPRTRARFGAAAQAWLVAADPGAFNQAMMELGATVCLPRQPRCGECPLEARCQARAHGTEQQLPVKLRKQQAVELSGVLLIVQRGGRVLLRRRPADAGHLPGFWELPSPEHLPGARMGAVVGEFRHSITHHRYTFEVRLATAAKPSAGEFSWKDLNSLSGLPLSTTAMKALRLAGIVPAR